MRSLLFFVGLCVALTATAASQGSFGPEYALEVFPAEHQTRTDPGSGAALLFLTSNPARDTNFYFHERSWMADNSAIFFYSDRERGGLMGYIVETGELFRVDTPEGGVGAATAAVNRNSIFVMRGLDAVEIAITITPGQNGPSTVAAKARVIATVMGGEGMTSLNESCEGKYLALGVRQPKDGGDSVILLVEEQSGVVTNLCRIPMADGFAYHVQWSHTNPNLLSFAGYKHRLNVVDIRTGAISNPYIELPGELVTHEHWWVNDQIVFCGGLHPKPTEDAHVKVVDVHTGLVRIIGAGAWWPEGTPEQVSRYNYWHCAGSDDGRWVVADNWHGDITVFEAKTTRPHIVTSGHRTYGSGDHPHVGWDRLSKQVIFASHMQGNADVCVATIPEAWQNANP
ncbi:MAG: hypothetical protein IT365_17770 [Candidatus Hydrogenedentes bacterium]|nr:hypothetical protein [Candidatus Hydrogenedentota bacterium]